MSESRAVTVSLEILGDGVAVRAGSTTYALPAEELWHLTAEARRAAGGDLAAFGSLLWDSTLGRAGLGLASGTRMTLDIAEADEPGGLAGIPWECMVEPGVGLPVALHPDFSVARRPAAVAPRPGSPEAAPSPLRLLLVRPGAPMAPAFADSLERSLEDLAERGLADSLCVAGEGAAVTTALERQGPHAVHWIVDGPDLPGAAGIETVVARLLDLPAVPRLVVLTGADGGCPARGVAPGRLLYRLSAVGVEAVAVPYGKDFAAFAGTFWPRLYEDLARGATLAAALRRGRIRLSFAAGDTAVFLEPALWALWPDVPLVEKGGSGDEARGSHLVVRGRLSSQPFMGLSPYGETDAGAFFGREDEIRAVQEAFLPERRLLLYGASGTGKTSLLRAGLLPALRDIGLQPVYVSRCAEPTVEILAGLGSQPRTDATPTVAEVLAEIDRRLAATAGLFLPILLDQAEDLIHFAGRKELLRGLLKRTREEPSRCALLLALRTDARLAFRHEIDSVSFDRPMPEIELRPLTVSQARSLLERLRGLYGLGFEKGLEERLLADLAAAPDPAAQERSVLLPQLSLVLRLLYERRQRSPALLLLDEYRRIEVDRLLPDQLRQVPDLLDEEAARAVPQVLVRLVDATTRRPTAAVPAGIAAATGLDPAVVSRVIEALVRRHLALRLPDGRVQLVHEILARTVCAAHLPPDLAERDAVLGLLRIHLPRWQEAGEPLPPEILDRVRRVAPRLELPTPELGLYVGSILIAQPNDPAAELPELALDHAEELTAELRRSGSPRVAALALLFANALSPIRRGALLSFPAPPELQPHARFLAEALVPLLSRQALGIQESRDQNRSDLEEQRKETLQLLALSDLLRRPVGARDHATHLGLVRALCGGALRMLAQGAEASLLWPGPWVRQPALVLAALVLAIPLSWLAWPAGGESLGELWILLSALICILMTCAQAVQDAGILRALGSDLVSPSSPRESRRTRIRMLLRLTTGTLFSAGALFSLLHLLAVFSSWLHHSFFTWETARAPLELAGGLPASAVTLGIGLAHGVRDFFYGIPLLGSLLRAIMGLPRGLSGFVGAVATLGAFLLALFVAMGGFSVVLPAALAMSGILLFPEGLVAVLSCAGVDHALFALPARARWRRGVQVAALSALAGLALPVALSLSRAVLGLVRPFLWHPEVFYGAGAAAEFDRVLERFGREPLSVALGCLFPLAACLLIRGLGDRRVRLAAGLPFSSNEPKDILLRPLIAEGTEDSLRLVLRLVKKRASVRSHEIFATLCLMALGDERLLPRSLGARARAALAGEAEATLLVFGSGDWGAPDLMSFLRERSEEAEGEDAGRARRLLALAEKAAAAPPPAVAPAAPPSGWKKAGRAGLGFVALGFGYAFLFLLAHGARVLGALLVDLSFPLAAPVAVPLSDVGGTAGWMVRLIEIPGFLLLVGSPLLVRGLVRRRAGGAR
jgi:type II secretory pathway predicted ATPase ExeA